jgi:hypothetical protein
MISEHKKEKIVATDPKFYTYMCFECGDKWVKYREVKPTKRKTRR